MKLTEKDIRKKFTNPEYLFDYCVPTHIRDSCVACTPYYFNEDENRMEPHETLIFDDYNNHSFEHYGRLHKSQKHPSDVKQNENAPKVGLTLLEAMQSGKDFRQADWDPNISERGWIHVSSSTQGDILVYSDSSEPVTVDVVLLTKRYVVKPDKVEITKASLQAAISNVCREINNSPKTEYLTLCKAILYDLEQALIKQLGL